MDFKDQPHDKEPILIQTDSETFYKMIRKIVERMKSEDRETHTKADSDIISEKEAMRLLGISSRSTLQKYRDFSLITFYKLNRRTIRYSKASIENFIRSKKESFD